MFLYFDQLLHYGAIGNASPELRTLRGQTVAATGDPTSHFTQFIRTPFPWNCFLKR
jgi:hypothetical protein